MRDRAVCLSNRRRCGALALSFLAFGCALEASRASADDASPRNASYRIEARLDAGARSVGARALVRWRNDTRRPASDLCFHLYLNAFANNRTTLMKRLGGNVADWSRRFPGEWGGIDIEAIHMRSEDLTDSLEYIRPDDGNPDDRTLARLPLAHPVQPGQTIEVAFDFRARLPRIFMRSGHAAPYFFVAQWFPKVGVFEDGKWNCHQYHETTEFYSDFGTYDVALTVPADYVVGHTGVARGERDNGDGSKTIEVHADDVHDFAWTADPRFHVVTEDIDGIQARLLMQPNNVRHAPRYLEALRAGIRFYAKWFGPYPYPTITVVDPGPGAVSSGGMEYPMLITAATAWWIPRGVRIPEAVVIHELGHQYWYGLVANDEVTSPWLDEGLNSYVESVVMDETYGAAESYVDLFGLRMGAAPLLRLRYLAAPSLDAVVTPAYLFASGRSYNSIAYAKTALVLRSLENTAGRDTVLAALGDYYRAWRFRHPRNEDLTAVLTTLGGNDRADFVRHALSDPDVLDYAVSHFEVREVRPLEGRRVEREKSETPAETYRAEIIVERRGELRSPVDVVVSFEGGSETRESWKGETRWHRFDIQSTSRAAYAVVDPLRKLSLDLDRVNDSRMSSPATRGIVRLAGRWGLWMQALMHVLTSW